MSSGARIPVAHLLLSLQTGGLERIVIDLVNCASSGFEPFVTCLETSGPMARELRSPGTPVVVMNRKPGFRPWLAVPLARELRRRRTCVVHTHNTAAGFYGALAARLVRAPVIHTKHGQNLSGGNQRVVNRLAYLLTDHVVAVSESARDLALSEGVRPEHVSIIDNGVDLTRFADRSRRRAIARERLAVSADEVVVGTVGRLAMVKNHAMLIESASDAATRSARRVVLVIVGDGPERERLTAAAQAAPPGLRLFLAGAQRPEEWLPAFDIFALSSDSEGLPVALLEAMACGVPAVVTRVGAMAEVVDHGKAGLVVPPRDRVALAEAIGLLCGDEGRRTTVAEAGLVRVRERYNAEKMTRAYETLYLDVLGPR